MVAPKLQMVFGGFIFFGAHTVSPLLFRSSPPNIGGLVVAVVIDAIKGSTGKRRITHILVKILKLCPTFADLNAPTAVEWVFMVLGPVTSLTHYLPAIVQRSAALTVLFVATYAFIGRTYHFSFLASARLRNASLQVLTKHFLLSATNTPAQKFLLTSKPKHGPMVELFLGW
jgi:hypothetical protein